MQEFKTGKTVSQLATLPEENRYIEVFSFQKLEQAVWIQVKSALIDSLITGKVLMTEFVANFQEMS